MKQGSMVAKQRSGPTRYLWIALGCVAFALGTVGIVLPLLPTVPFYLLTVFCFARGSNRLHDWFVNTSFYEKNLAAFVQRRGMTMAAKLRIMIPVTVLMAFGFYMMHSTWGRAVIAIVWVAHVYYFVFRVPNEGKA